MDNSMLPILQDYLAYDERTGVLIWKQSPMSRIKPGDVAGSMGNRGFFVVKFRRRTFLAHRVIWFLVFKTWPGGEVDHIDGCRTNNQLSNLQLVSRVENCRSVGMSILNSSGYPGVY